MIKAFAALNKRRRLSNIFSFFKANFGPIIEKYPKAAAIPISPQCFNKFLYFSIHVHHFDIFQIVLFYFLPFPCRKV
jgi:hypothetical protein